MWVPDLHRVTFVPRHVWDMRSAPRHAPRFLLQHGRQRIDQSRSDRQRVVVWGAGAKGVMFLNLLKVTTGSGVDWVVDINPRKKGHFVPLRGQRIVGPDYLSQNSPDLVVVMNPE